MQKKGNTNKETNFGRGFDNLALSIFFPPGILPYLFSNESLPLHNQYTRGIIPMIVNTRSIHHPDLFTSCGRRTVTEIEGISVTTSNKLDNDNGENTTSYSQ